MTAGKCTRVCIVENRNRSYEPRDLLYIAAAAAVVVGLRERVSTSK